ncbi:MAG TPA: iron-sulfur cluster assembly scaffold protein [Candidatus Polarisedimenticolia bacterium]|nr:iron-sulfur cluster assembly scaffold protein [Candidatus Polarisedimenticolia bacterium]
MGESGGYNDVVLDHYRNPRNVGEIPGSAAVAQVGDPASGDVLRISLLIEDERVVDARFKSFGCTAAIAVGSMTTTLIKGMRLVDLERLSNRDVVEALGGLPEGKIRCSVLAEEAIREAVRRYRGTLSTGARKDVSCH